MTRLEHNDGLTDIEPRIPRWYLILRSVLGLINAPSGQLCLTKHSLAFRMCTSQQKHYYLNVISRLRQCSHGED